MTWAKKNSGGAALSRQADIPLQRVLVVLFVVQALLAVGLVGYVSFRNARGAVNEVAGLLRSEVAARIEERIEQFLDAPRRLNQVNAELFRQGILDPEDPESLVQHFWRQVLAAPSVTSVYFGNTKGGVADAGREGPEGSLYEILTDGFTAGTFRKFGLDESGHRLAELQAVSNFDARSRAWFTGAISAGGPMWSPIYLLFSGQDMAISTSQPVYGPDGILLGVVSADLFLSQVGRFLRSLEIGTNGQSFIVERSGLLVASAADPSPIVLGGEAAVSGHSAPRRLSAGESQSPVVRAAAAALAEHGHGQETSRSEFRVGEETHFLDAVSVRSGHGVDWLVVVTVPERDFMAKIEASTQTTMALVLAAAVLAMAFGAITAHRVTQPIRHLGTAARAVAQGEWRKVEGTSRITEIAALSTSFDLMTYRLEETVGSLEKEVAERRRAEAELRTSEQRYRLLADNSTDVIWTIDLSGRFTYVSPAIQRLRGYTPEEVLREPLAAALTPESLAAVQKALADLRALIADGLPLPEESRFELEQPCKDGTTVWTETITSPLFDADGTLQGILGVSRNITARRVADQEKLALEARLRQSQKLESIGTLASGVAHEVNNPLTGIINYAELIERRVDDPQLREFAQGIMNEGNRVAEIVRGLLSFARQESSERQAAQMPDILHAALTLLGASLRRDQIRLEQTVAEGTLPVRCNPQQLQQILINLLTNARDALNRKYPGPHADKVVRIDIGPFTRAGSLWIRTTVEDHGIGIPEELLTRIFDPFFTTKPRDLGTGLGLSISYGIAAEHGGSLWVESSEGVATRFHLDLPAA